MSGLTIGILLLGAGTFAIRVAGFGLGSRGASSPERDRVLTQLTTILLVGVVATTAFAPTADAGLRAGVAAGAVAALLRAPLPVVVVVAAVVAAGVRLL